MGWNLSCQAQEKTLHQAFRLAGMIVSREACFDANYLTICGSKTANGSQTWRTERNPRAPAQYRGTSQHKDMRLAARTTMVSQLLAHLIHITKLSMPVPSRLHVPFSARYRAKSSKATATRFGSTRLSRCIVCKVECMDFIRRSSRGHMQRRRNACIPPYTQYT